MSNSPLSLSGSSCAGAGETDKPITVTARCLPTRATPGNTRSVSDSALHLSPATSTLQFDQGEDSFSGKPKRRISFDERVSVREFESNSWHMVRDSEQLSPIIGRKPAITVPAVILCPRDHQQQGGYDFLPFPHCPSSPPSTRASSISSTSFSLQGLLQHEIRRILMVDPHDIFLTLFSKRLQQAMPHPVEILTAHSSDEALDLCSKQSFDVIIAEERLSLFHRHTGGAKVTSGSALLGHLRQHSPKQFQHALLIGVSAHWQSDHATMVQSGADCCWSKAPPPTLNKTMLEELLHTLLLKREKHELAKTLMVISSSGEGPVLSSSPPDERQ